MATIEIPDELVEPWPRLDEAFELLQGSAQAGGVSAGSIGAVFTAVIGRAPWQNPSFALWAYIRHGAASYFDFKHILVGSRTDRHADRPRPFLKVDEPDDEDDAIIDIGPVLTED